MLSFASFSFIGNIGFVLRNQGVNLVLNIFFGPAINAARGVAYQVSTQVSSFAGNFQMAATPQITKTMPMVILAGCNLLYINPPNILFVYFLF